MTTNTEVLFSQLDKKRVFFMTPTPKTFSGDEGDGSYTQVGIKYNMAPDGQPPAYYDCIVRGPEMKSERGLHSISAKSDKKGAGAAQAQQAMQMQQMQMQMQLMMMAQQQGQQAFAQPQAPAPEPKKKYKKLYLDGLCVDQKNDELMMKGAGQVHEAVCDLMEANQHLLTSLNQVSDKRQGIIMATKVLWYTPTDKGKPIPGARPQFQYFHDRFTVYVLPNNQEVPQDIMERCSCTYIPRWKYAWVYIGGGKVSVQIPLVSATILEIAEANSMSRPLELNKELVQAKPEIVDKAKEALERLMAKAKTGQAGASGTTKTGEAPKASESADVKTPGNVVTPAKAGPGTLQPFVLPTLPVAGAQPQPQTGGLSDAMGKLQQQQRGIQQEQGCWPA